MPATLFETPEVSGEFLKGEIGLGAATGVEYVTVKNVLATPPRSSGSRISGTSSEIAFRLGLGVGKRFEISYSTPFVLAKWQFLGSNRLTAQSEQWLGAVMAGYANSHNKDTASSLLTDGIETAFTRVDTEAESLGMIIGYRFNKAMLMYGTLNEMFIKSKTAINFETDKYQYKDNAHQRAAMLGIRWTLDDQKFIGIEGSLSLNSMDNAEDFTGRNLGVLFGAQWY